MMNSSAPDSGKKSSDKFGGTVLSAGYNECGKCSVEDWTDIVAIYAGFQHGVGLKADGTILYIGSYDDGMNAMDSRHNISLPKISPEIIAEFQELK